MKNYKVFKHQDGRIEAVKQGWSWPGFFFGLIWALVKKLWALAGILIILAIASGIIFAILTPNPHNYTSYYAYNDAMKTAEIWALITNILTIVIAIVLGLKGNLFRENDLLKKGYELIGTVEAPNPDIAVIEAKKAETSNIISHM